MGPGPWPPAESSERTVVITVAEHRTVDPLPLPEWLLTVSPLGTHRFTFNDGMAPGMGMVFLINGCTSAHGRTDTDLYLPGLGWRGFDPTHGTDVGDAHVAVAAAADPEGAAPVSGSYVGTAGSTLTAAVRISASG